MNISCVIVTYNPEINNLKGLTRQLAKKSDFVYIVDNNSLNISEIMKLNSENIEVISLDNNLGIAKAQNIGICRLLNSTSDFLMFFDQDSQIDKNYIDSILGDYNFLFDRNENIGLIGPRFIDERYGFYYKTVNMNKFGIRKKINVSNIDQPLHSALLISSGSLVSVDTLKKVGFMRENYFIDYVDTEWCIRAESMGYKNFISSSATMVHAIGDNVLQFKYFNVPVHSPFRRYYRVRNAYYMLREPHVPILLALREILFNFIHQIFLIVFEDDKKGYIKSYIRGCIDGMFKYEKNNDN